MPTLSFEPFYFLESCTTFVSYVRNSKTHLTLMYYVINYTFTSYKITYLQIRCHLVFSMTQKLIINWQSLLFPFYLLTKHTVLNSAGWTKQSLKMKKCFPILYGHPTVFMMIQVMEQFWWMGWPLWYLHANLMLTGLLQFIFIRLGK